MRRQKGFWGQKSGVNDGSLYMRPTSDRSASTRSKRASFQDTDDCDDAASCTWCKPYRRVCTRCACFTAGAPYCPCRYTKDLTKIWKRQENLASFTRERTLIVENTPQQCIGNYGNAIYVPTYTGQDDDSQQEEEDFDFRRRFQKLALELEAAENVRHVVKCRHRKGPHACYEQSWWNY